MRTITLLIFALTCVAGCNPSEEAAIAATAPPATTRASGQGTKAEAVARDYAKLTLVTPEAVYVNPELAMLCRGASQEDVERARKTQGPHAHTRIRVFMSAGAAKTFKLRQENETSAAPVYPVGSIVVKEKKGASYFVGRGEERSKTHDGVGGMIKREKGYDPEHGDWEYFYFEDPAKVESGRITSCVACHAGAATTDYVFGSWAKHVE
jgi:hypothetical protein